MSFLNSSELVQQLGRTAKWPHWPLIIPSFIPCFIPGCHHRDDGGDFPFGMELIGNPHGKIPCQSLEKSHEFTIKSHQTTIVNDTTMTRISCAPPHLLEIRRVGLQFHSINPFQTMKSQAFGIVLALTWSVAPHMLQLCCWLAGLPGTSHQNPLSKKLEKSLSLDVWH